MRGKGHVYFQVQPIDDLVESRPCLRASGETCVDNLVKRPPSIRKRGDAEMQKPSRLSKSQPKGDVDAFPRLVDDEDEQDSAHGAANAAEQALRESEERYRALVDGSLAGTLVTRGEATLFASRRLAEIFGYQTDEFLALESIYEIVTPSDRERLKKYEGVSVGRQAGA